MCAAVNDEGQVKPAHFDELVGTEWLSSDPDDARARLELRDELRQPFGLMHGGVMSTLIESICSRATAIAVFDQGLAAMGQSIHVSFVRPVTEGTVEIEARALHRGRTTWVWDAEAKDSKGKLAALAHMTVVVRPIRESGS